MLKTPEITKSDVPYRFPEAGIMFPKSSLPGNTLLWKIPETVGIKGHSPKRSLRYPLFSIRAAKDLVVLETHGF